jgi:hypothetical protein
LIGDEMTSESPGADNGALVACGSAGLGNASSGWSSLEEVMSPTPAGVGVNGGGGLSGDSPSPLPFAVLRFLGSGVAGRSGTGKSNSGRGEDGAGAVVLRFFGAVLVGRGTFVYFAPRFAGLFSGKVGTEVFATRAERRRDMVKCFLCVCGVVLIRKG